jgi:hypothetical protein
MAIALQTTMDKHQIAVVKVCQIISRLNPTLAIDECGFLAWSVVEAMKRSYETQHMSNIWNGAKKGLAVI